MTGETTTTEIYAVPVPVAGTYNKVNTLAISLTVLNTDAAAQTFDAWIVPNSDTAPATNAWKIFEGESLEAGEHRVYSMGMMLPGVTGENSFGTKIWINPSDADMTFTFNGVEIHQ